MTVGTSTTAVDELVRLLDHTLDEEPSGFGWDHDDIGREEAGA